MTTDTTFLPGPNLRVARNDSGMSIVGASVDDAGQQLIHLVTDKVDPLVPASYTDDVHTNSDGSQVRVQRAKPAPLPENATLQDRLRRYSPVNGYARYCAMAADKIDQLEKELQASRNLNCDLNNQVTALKIANESLEADQATMLRVSAALNRIVLQSSNDAQKQASRAIEANAKLHQIRERGFWTRIYHAFKGEKA